MPTFDAFTHLKSNCSSSALRRVFAGALALVCGFFGSSAVAGGLYLNEQHGAVAPYNGGAIFAPSQGPNPVLSPRQLTEEVALLHRHCTYLMDAHARLMARHQALANSRRWTAQEMLVINRSFAESGRRLGLQMRPCGQLIGFSAPGS